MVQLVPASFGRTSATVTFRATPAPLLLTAMVNPMGSPAETGEASATLVTARSGHLTVMEAGADPEPSLVVVKLARLLTTPQVSAVVGEVMWTEADDPEVRSKEASPQVSVPDEIEQ